MHVNLNGYEVSSLWLTLHLALCQLGLALVPLQQPKLFFILIQSLFIQVIPLRQERPMMR